ncbi:MAG: TrkA family potassium uptake protein [Chloroherpetonaceae bacterium]|nr:TrkA family potassium uptake protein [Chloroherpetonaceae bacterium]MCS7210872.1 TrkA family potassium uptake protein [Chloroherpetonaceae bacterium]MDW8019853.1 TrkA family potassium uptake protein [Chloroherpetonaceae bacterium]MDW8465080.1 TrkA family potassium uptake protein [Chloroherpetonaceae bacterium]
MAKKIAVIGIGNFGSHLATTLAAQGAEVLAIDSSMERLEDIKDKVTYTVRLDSTEEKALREQAITEFDVVIVAIGDDFEATLLTVAALQNIGVQRIIARATTQTHERILRHLGISEVISPAVEAAERLADSLMYRGVIDSLELSSEYSIVEVSAPPSFVGKTLAELNLRENFDVNLITIKRIEQEPRLLGLRSRTIEKIMGIPTPDMVVQKNDILVLFAKKPAINKMCNGSAD